MGLQRLNQNYEKYSLPDGCLHVCAVIATVDSYGTDLGLQSLCLILDVQVLHVDRSACKSHQGLVIFAQHRVITIIFEEGLKCILIQEFGCENEILL